MSYLEVCKSRAKPHVNVTHTWPYSCRNVVSYIYAMAQDVEFGLFGFFSRKFLFFLVVISLNDGQFVYTHVRMLRV